MPPRWAARVPRLWTVVGGVALAALLLAALALVGGVDGPSRRRAAPPEHLGPLTAVQPQLHRALLTGEDLPPPGPDPAGSATGPAGAPSPAADPAPEPLPEPALLPPVPTPAGLPSVALPERTELCRTLFEDPGSLASSIGGEGTAAAATGPDTGRDGGRGADRRGHRGSWLRHALSVFDSGRAPEAYRHLHRIASGCRRFTAALDDGTVVTVLLRRLVSGREIAGLGGAGIRRGGVVPDEAYIVQLTVTGPDDVRTGYLAVDRVGPVLSVLRHLGADGAPPPDAHATRRAALDKLLPLTRLLRTGGHSDQRGTGREGGRS